MDLTDMFTEPSLINHDWWDDGLTVQGRKTFDPELAGSKNPNNVKNELAIEWGTAGPDISIDEPAGVVQRHIPEEDQADAGPVIIFARDLMNQGIMGETLSRRLKAQFAPGILRLAGTELRDQLSLQGIVGCVAVDGRGYEDCNAALNAASNSPYKGFIKYVIGCECGDHQMLPKAAPRAGEGLMASITSMPEDSDAEAGNAVDSFLADEKPHQMEMVAHCRSTMLPAVASRGDLDPSEMDSTLVELMNVTGLPEDEVEKLRKDKHNDKYSSLHTLQKAFRLVNHKMETAGEERYAKAPDASEHVILQADNEIELGSSPMGDIEIDPVNRAAHTDIEVEAKAPTNFDGPSSLGSEIVADLMSQPDQSQVHVELTSGSDEQDVGLKAAEEPKGALEVNPFADEMGVELKADKGEMDVDMRQFEEPEFVDTDIIALEIEKAPPGELDIQLGAEMTI